MRDKRIIQPNILRWMSAEDRKKLGVRTEEELVADSNLIVERELHRQFRQWLFSRGFEYCYHSDPVRRPTISAGLPDFGVFRDSRILFIEIKVGKNTLSETQERCLEKMGLDGNVILVCHTFTECMTAVCKFFNLPI